MNIWLYLGRTSASFMTPKSPAIIQIYLLLKLLPMVLEWGEIDLVLVTDIQINDKQTH